MIKLIKERLEYLKNQEFELRVQIVEAFEDAVSSFNEVENCLPCIDIPAEDEGARYFREEADSIVGGFREVENVACCAADMLESVVEHEINELEEVCSQIEECGYLDEHFSEICTLMFADFDLSLRAAITKHREAAS